LDNFFPNIAMYRVRNKLIRTNLLNRYLIN